MKFEKNKWYCMINSETFKSSENMFLYKNGTDDLIHYQLSFTYFRIRESLQIMKNNYFFGKSEDYIEVDHIYFEKFIRKVFECKIEEI